MMKRVSKNIKRQKQSNIHTIAMILLQKDDGYSQSAHFFVGLKCLQWVSIPDSVLGRSPLHSCQVALT